MEEIDERATVRHANIVTTRLYDRRARRPEDSLTFREKSSPILRVCWHNRSLTMLLASMIAMLVFFIATTDHPYCGVNAIKPRAYETALRDLTDTP